MKIIGQPSTSTTKQRTTLYRYWALALLLCGLLATAFASRRFAPRKRQEDHSRKPSAKQGLTLTDIPMYPQAMPLGMLDPETQLCSEKSPIQLCQALGNPGPMYGVDCQGCNNRSEAHWDAWRPIAWDTFSHGEYVGPHRPQHVPEYRLRVDDILEFVYRLTHEEISTPYELNVTDRIRVESLTDEKIDRELIVQPDGNITLRLLGQIRAAGRTVDDLRLDLEKRYKKYYKVPAITVTPLEVNTKLKSLRDVVDVRFGQGGQNRVARVTPEGTIQLPAIGSVPAQGLTLDELQREIEERYNQVVLGMEVTPVLQARAPRFVYVLGEVQTSGRYEMLAPTTVMQAISMAGGWNNGGNLREIVVFRRGEDWRLIATRLDMRGALLGKRPCPADEIWLRDSDIVVIPKSPILLADDFIELFFTRGVYGIIPFQGISLNFAKASTL